MTVFRLRAHYGLSRMPFGRDLAAGAMHAHHGHAEAVARIRWCVTEEVIGVITGEVGSSETVAIITALGGSPRFHKAALIPQATDALATERNERNKTVVVVYDEAHLLGADQLEELRLLTNADMDSASPFACLLVGQPTLRRRVRLGAFAALDQRIPLRFAMPAMDLAETAGYIAHHLALAGRSDTLFSDDAIALIHQSARGLPRAVNNLAIQSFVAAYADGKGIVDESSARAAITEITTE